jgi:hypothetical protein
MTKFGTSMLVYIMAWTIEGTSAQTVADHDAVIKEILAEGTQRSRLYSHAQSLMDSGGPRLTGSPEQKRANAWAIDLFQNWGIPARSEQYGAWLGWSRGTFHADLLQPRIRSLEGMLLTWSPGTRGPVSGPVLVFPDVKSPSEFEAWLPLVKGKFVLISFAEPTCRPDENWKEHATPESFSRIIKERDDARNAWYAGLRRSGLRGRDLIRRLEDAGALGLVTSMLAPPEWTAGWGVSKIGSASAERIPEVGLSCEDCGLVFRLADNDQGPVLRLDANAEFLGDVPVSNVIAELRGKEKPEEFVLLSAHFDSWDAASGTTDNGATAVAMMEAMRILKVVNPNPKRTILAGLWSGEEQGFNGSRAFAADHPEVSKGMQAIFDHDNGTGRVIKISVQGFTGAEAPLRRWLSQMPNAITKNIVSIETGTPETGVDASSFTCSGAPAFAMSSVSWDYEKYTWHTNRDTFDKLILDDLKNNATLFAILAYLASEDAERIPQELRVTLIDPKTGAPKAWPACTPPMQSSPQRGR